MTIPSAKRKIIYEHLCFIDDLFLTKKPRSETFKKIFDSLMDIYDQKKKKSCQFMTKNSDQNNP